MSVQTICRMCKNSQSLNPPFTVPYTHTKIVCPYFARQLKPYNDEPMSFDEAMDGIIELERVELREVYHGMPMRFYMYLITAGPSECPNFRRKESIIC